MVCFGFRSAESIDEFMLESSERAEQKNFFFSSAEFKRVSGIYIISLASFLPRVLLWFFVIMGLAALFFNVIVGVIISWGLALAWWFVNSRYFIFLLLKAGLRKSGNKTKVWLVSDEELKAVLLSGAERGF